jgi:hypothetical protein
MNRFSCRKIASLFIGVFLGGAFFMPPSPAHSEETLNMRFIWHTDLQGRSSLQVVLKGNYAYIGHHRGQAFLKYAGGN